VQPASTTQQQRARQTTNDVSNAKVPAKSGNTPPKSGNAPPKSKKESENAASRKQQQQSAYQKRQQTAEKSKAPDKQVSNDKGPKKKQRRLLNKVDNRCRARDDTKHQQVVREFTMVNLNVRGLNDETK
jgi:hypothetical protein